jgi:dephospho-CoA kinase
MSYVLGLTGSIGMGKSTTAQMLKDMGLPVWDADLVVHDLYAAGGAAVAQIAGLAPDSINAGAVDRSKLRAAIAAQPSLLDAVQSIVHPLVAANRAQFLAASAAPIVVLDIPLLFEIGADAFCDGVIVVSAPAEVQRERVLARGLPQAEFETILARQMPDADKRARATWVVPTNSLPQTRDHVRGIIAQITKGLSHA